MTMTPRARKLALTAHITSSVGWLGTVAGFQALAIAAVMTQEPEAIRGFYRAMQLIGWYVILPFCAASVVTGLVLSLGTRWGLFRYYWVAVKFLITVIAALILVGFSQTLVLLGRLAADPATSLADLRGLEQSPALHSGGGLAVLLLTTIIAVYKPWGLTPWGRRSAYRMEAPDGSAAGVPRRGYLILGSIGLVLVLLVLHLLQGGTMRH